GTISISQKATAGGLTQSYPAGSGGLVGNHYLAPPLVNYFGMWGVYMVLVTVGILAGLMLAQDVTEVLLAMVGRGTTRLAQLAWDRITHRLRADAATTASVLAPAAAP